MDPIPYKIIIKVLFTSLDPSPCDSTCMNNVSIDPGRKCSLGEFRCNNTVMMYQTSAAVNPGAILQYITVKVHHEA